MRVFAKLAIVTLTFASLFAFIRSDCGFPGIPNGADIENLEDLKYYENTTVIYRCKNPKDRTLSLVPNDLADRDPFTGYMRTCVKGKWVEPLPRCGKYLLFSLFFQLFIFNNGISSNV